MFLFKHFVSFILFVCISFAETIDIYPIPKDTVYDKQKAILGKILFQEPLISQSGTMSCNACHSLSFAHNKNINSPTVFNSYFNFSDLWDSKYQKDVITELFHPNTDIGIKKSSLLEILNNSPFYKDKFQNIFKQDKITYTHFVDVIVEFQKALITPDAKFDKYLRGETDLEPNELRGFELFKSEGCISCHNGINLGGNSYQAMGIISPLEQKDRSRFIEDLKTYKVPILRNVDIGAPYFHDDSLKTLLEAIKKVSRLNFGIIMDNQDANDIMAFLKTLRGKKPRILNE